MVEISDYLQDYVRQTNKGTCKACGKVVQWCRSKVAAHKRANCPQASPEERRLFVQPVSPILESNDSDISMNSIPESVIPMASRNIPLTIEEKNEIDSALAKFVLRTGIPFRVIDSEAFRDFVTLLRPEYAKEMPKSRTLSGVLLNKEYNEKFSKLSKIMEKSNELTLITDGWTNTNGDHIVNFIIKAPSQSSMFYKSIDTSGIIQNTDNTAGAILKILEKLGPQKFTSVVTDNVPVCRSAWKVIEEKYPHISAYGCAAHGVNLIEIIEKAFFWTSLSNVVKLIEYPVNIIGKLEADKAELSLVYHYFSELLEHFKNDRVILPKVQERWDFIKKDTHTLAYILTPKFAIDGSFIDDKFEEASKIKAFSEKTTDAATAQATAIELTQFVGDLTELTGDQKEMIKTMTAKNYWDGFGRHKYPLVYACAKSINAMICSSASAERVWSIFGFVHKPLRNRLSNEKVEKLVFLYVNSGMLDEKDKNDYILEQCSCLNENDFDD